MNILILDDDAFFTRTVAAQLRSAASARDMRLDIFESQKADEAIERLWAGLEDIGLVICDLQMPEMDGVEFVRLLSRMTYRGGLALISGEDTRILQTARQMAESLNLDVVGSFEKPISLDEVGRLLDNNLPLRKRHAAAPSSVYSPDQLRHAIELQQLVNHYQPKVDMRSSALVGVEALVRWAHPRDGLVMPGAFIPMAESNGLVGAVGDCVVRQALRDLREWGKAGIAPQVAVNVALGSLVSVDFPDQLSMLVREAGLPPERLVLEITETRLMENPQAELDVLARLRLKGFHLSIDDFGTGYSGLDRLRTLPFNELKIDRSFVRGAAGNPSSRAIVDASLTAAHQLGLITVAEGIEEAEDWDLLKSAGCKLAQGYLIAKPMSAEQLVGWAAEWRERKASIEST